MAPVILFDGTCNFCDRVTHFILDRERGRALKFAAIQSEAGRKLLEAATTQEHAHILTEGANGEGDPDSVVLVDGGRLYTHSAAALRIVRHLRWPWRGLGVFVIVPRPIRDAAYRWFARHRYQWFGKTDSCRVPTPDLRARFL